MVYTREVIEERELPPLGALQKRRLTAAGLEEKKGAGSESGARLRKMGVERVMEGPTVG